jgi:hypothetical protein
MAQHVGLGDERLAAFLPLLLPEAGLEAEFLSWMFRHIACSLRPGGIVVLLDFRDRGGGARPGGSLGCCSVMTPAGEMLVRKASGFRRQFLHIARRFLVNVWRPVRRLIRRGRLDAQCCGLGYGAQ